MVDFFGDDESAVDADCAFEVIGEEDVLYGSSSSVVATRLRRIVGAMDRSGRRDTNAEVLQVRRLVEREEKGATEGTKKVACCILDGIS